VPVRPLQTEMSSMQDVLKDTVLVAAPPLGALATAESLPLSMGSNSFLGGGGSLPGSPLRQLPAASQAFHETSNPASLAASVSASVAASVASPSSPLPAALPAAIGTREALPMASVTVTGVDRNRDGIPDVLQGLPPVERVVLPRTTMGGVQTQVRVQTQDVLSSSQSPSYPMELREGAVAKEGFSPIASPAVRSTVSTEPASPANTLPLSPPSPMGSYAPTAMASIADNKRLLLQRNLAQVP